MIDFKGWVCSGFSERHAGYDKITGLLCWMLIVLVALYLNVFTGLSHEDSVLLDVSCLALFCYRTLIGRVFPAMHLRLKGVLDLSLLLFFVSVVCWCTGKMNSPFLCVYYLVLMISAFSLGRRMTHLLAAGSVLSFLGMAWAAPSAPVLDVACRVVALLPFVLAADLAALLSGEAEKERAEVERLSLTDDLTHLNNMRSFDNLARQQEKLSRRYRRPYAICMLDADNLKEINERFGHLAGTELIKWTARIIGENTRECDIAARFGGDEFIIMFEGHDKEQIRPAVERIVLVMSVSPFTFEGHQVQATLSAGIASYPADGEELRSVIMKADKAMYLSKRRGKNRVTLCPDEGARRGRAMLQVGGEQLRGPVPQFHRKTTSVHLGEGDFPGRSEGNGASVFKDSGKS
jgi:diguanylate cyclase (GGDEF)-like protein